MEQKNIVCLGGGIGTVNLIKGLKHFTKNITVIISTADDGGSAGRLRRLYNVLPPGDVISCVAALSDDEDNPLLAKLLTYRFPGDRYGKDDILAGHKLGSLMLVAAWDLTGSIQEGIKLLQKTFKSVGTIIPATEENIALSAVTVDGVEVKTEENIDLGKYNGQRILEKIFIQPENPTVPDEVIDAIGKADAIIAGPGDLYTTLLPVLIIPRIKEAILKAKSSKIFIVNVANKPFETKDYSVTDFIQAIEKHISSFPFAKVIVNNNFNAQIPEQLKYTFVKLSDIDEKNYEIINADILDESFPIYHDSDKLASLVYKEI